ncbi:ABC transporter permease [Aureimonas sp. ME7]|uniref:ABC transporter permease n=1 Tax=Aureimonas sp. ME7 TaxID=2744252 RepID=UPI0015F35ADC|nr:ABC transporter permease [Aureimonas sp. ME7]
MTLSSLPVDEPASRSATTPSDAPARRIPAWVQLAFERSIAIAAFLALWEIAPRLGWVNATFLPPFSDVLVVGYDYAIQGKLWPHVEVSLVRALGGFSLGVVTAVPLGIVLGWYKGVDRYLNPLLQLLRQTNPVSLFPIFILFFGIGYMTKVAIIYWVVVWPILLGTISGIRYVDPALVKYARSMALSDRQLFLKVVVPSSIPSLITGMRLAATYSFLMLVVSEMVGANNGLGYLVVNSQYLMSIHLLYVGVIILALLGITANWLLVLLERRLTSWKVEPNL